MQVRTFQARQIREALAQVRREMGADAVILSTRKLRRGLGLLPSAGIEVTAALEAAPVPPLRTEEAAVDPDTERQMGTLRREMRVLREQLRETSDLAANLTAELPTPGAGWQRLLEEVDVDPTLAGEIVRAALAAVPDGAGSPEMRAAVDSQIVRRLVTAPTLLRGAQPGTGPTRRIAAIVGPTGVGKTTTIAKLAARATIDCGLRVALVTLDTYRIGAVSQLSRYAQLIGVPLEVARDPQSFQAACRRLAQADLILCDTAGRGDERAAAQKIAACLGAEPGVDIHLAVCAATRRADLRAVLRRFAPLGPSRMIVTKVDETSLFGGLLNAVVWSGLPLSYVTCGQRVPEDIEEADAAVLGPRILGGEAN